VYGAVGAGACSLLAMMFIYCGAVVYVVWLTLVRQFQSRGELGGLAPEDRVGGRVRMLFVPAGLIDFGRSESEAVRHSF